MQYVSDGAPVSPLRAWTSLALIIFLYVVSFMDRQIISLLVEPIKRDFSLNDADIGLLQGFAFAIPYCIAGLPIGWVVDRYSRRFVILAGVLGWSLAAMAAGFTRNFSQLFAARAGVGIGEASLGPASFSLISDMFPRERLATALSFYTTGSNIGGGMAFLIGGLLVSAITVTPLVWLPLFGTIASWQAVFVAVGAPGLLLAFIALLLAEPRRRHEGRGRTSVGFNDLLAALRQRRSALLAHWIAFPLLGLCAYTIAAWLPAWSMRSFGWGPARVGPLIGLTQAVLGTATTLAGGFFTDHAYRRGLRAAHFTVPAITCSVGAAICVAGLLLGNASPWVAFWTVLLGSVVQSAFGGAAFSSLQLIMPPQMRGRTSAIYIFVLNLVGFGMGPFLVGWLTDHLFERPQDIGKAMALTVAGATTIAVIALLLGRTALANALAASHERAATKG